MTTSTLQLTAAPIWKRLAAWFYDFFLVIAILFIATAFATLITAIAGLDYNQGSPLLDSLLFKLYLLLFWFAYFYWSWKKAGQTIGMKAWKIKLVPNNSTSINFKICVIRFLSGFLGLSILTGYFFKNRNAIHDKLSQSTIIRAE